MIPQPASEPYDPGDRVRVYLDESDPDVEHHGTECVVVERLQDDLSVKTGRELDQYSYLVETQETGEELPMSFRHSDLVQPQNVGSK